MPPWPDVNHANGVPPVIDNTVPSPFLCNPLALGADIVVHSATKYLGGRGAALSPTSAWQIPQGIDTLPLRRERHCVNARKVAAFPRAHPQLSWGNYPRLPDRPRHGLVAQQMRAVDGAPGASCRLAFGVKSQTAGAAGGVAAGVLPDLVRISVGIEHIDDILWNIDQALAGTGGCPEGLETRRMPSLYP